jgi:glycerophosphoryl diester phosphodiesterase
MTAWPYPYWIAHRGAGKLAPENTLAAFRLGARYGYRMFECDAKLSADGTVFLLHDATLERTTDGIGQVAALTSDAVRRLRIKGCHGEPPPLLGDMLDALVGSPVAPRIEIKSDEHGRPYRGLVPRVLDTLDRKRMRSAAWLIAFDAEVAAEAAAAGGIGGVTWLIEHGTWCGLGMRGTIAAAKAYGFPEIGVHESLLDAQACASLRAAGIRISVWGANHDPAIRRMLGLGIDVLTTDDPPLAIALRDRI